MILVFICRLGCDELCCDGKGEEGNRIQFRNELEIGRVNESAGKCGPTCVRDSTTQRSARAIGNRQFVVRPVMTLVFDTSEFLIPFHWLSYHFFSLR